MFRLRRNRGQRFFKARISLVVHFASLSSLIWIEPMYDISRYLMLQVVCDAYLAAVHLCD